MANEEAPFDKRAFIRELRAHVAREVATLSAAARDAREAATHEEAKPENDKDTRAIEASYLAGAQANRVRELEQIANALEFLPLRVFAAGDAIGLSALIGVSEAAPGGSEERLSHYFLAPSGGGLRAVVGGVDVQVVTPPSPMGQALVGREEGDEVELRGRGALRRLTVVSVT